MTEPGYRIWKDTAIELEVEALFYEGGPSREDILDTLRRMRADYERRIERLLRYAPSVEERAELLQLGKEEDKQVAG